MNERRFAFLTVLAGLLLASACSSAAPESPGPADAAAVAAAPVDFPNPALAGSQVPNLFATADGRVHMSWTEPSVDGHTLQFATLATGANTWSEPTTVISGGGFFVNWADFPSIIETSDGGLASHWLERAGEGAYAYGVRVAQFVNGAWSDPRTPHDDDSPTEHGFVSLVPEPDGGFTAIWLDGRAFAGDAGDDGHGASTAEMSLRSRRYASDGTAGAEQLIDSRTCDCCQTGAAYLGDTLVAVYRDRSDDETRDIYVARRTGGEWSEPTPVAADGWTIPGCPVNGPMVVSTGGDGGAVAWFALVDQTPEVKVAFTADAGASFSAPRVVERGDADRATLGRVGIVPIGTDRVLVTWLTNVGGIGEIRYRTVSRDGELSPTVTLAETNPARSSGFPRVVATPDRLVFAWTDSREAEPVLRTATLPISPDDAP